MTKVVLEVFVEERDQYVLVEELLKEPPLNYEELGGSDVLDLCRIRVLQEDEETE